MTTENTAIDSRINDVATAFADNFNISSDSTFVLSDDTTADKFVEGLLKGVSLATMKLVDEEKAILASVLLLGAGRMAVNHCAENPEVKRVSGEIMVGKDTVTMSFTKPTTRSSDGSWKDPSVTVVNRRYEHSDHGKVRREIYALTKSIMS